MEGTPSNLIETDGNYDGKRFTIVNSEYGDWTTLLQKVTFLSLMTAEQL